MHQGLENVHRRLVLSRACAIIIKLIMTLYIMSSFTGVFVVHSKTNPVRLLSEDYDIWSCDWGSNGRIVFSGKPKGDNGMQLRVWLYRLNENDPILWTGTGSLIDLSPKWAPDGSGVVMIRRRISYTGFQGIHSSVWWKAFPSGEGLRLTKGPWDADPDWSPDGNRIVFVKGEGPNRTSLAVVDKDGGKVDIIVPTQEGVISSPSWGKDGRIYYTRMEKNSRTAGIFYVEMKTGEEHVLLKDKYDHRFPAISPNGRLMAYVSTRSLHTNENRLVMDRGALYVYDLKTGKHHLITDGVSLNGAPPVWSPDGKKLVFFSFRKKRPAMWVVSWR